MKGFSWRSTALLMLPCLILPVAALLASRFSLAPGGIEVQKSARCAPTALDFSHGAAVGVQVKLNERPDDNSAVGWKVVFHVTAGNHRLWDSQAGDGERKIFASSWGLGGWDEWSASFNLKTVPPEWGAVVLRWQAYLTQARHISLGFKKFALAPEKTSRSGKIVLRNIGEKLDYSSKISRNPHFKFVDYEITRLKKRKGGGTYRVILILKRDATPYDGVGRNFGTQVALKGLRADGTESGFGSESGGGEDTYNLPSNDAEKANRLSSVTTGFDLYEQPRRGRIEAEISFKNFWPLKISVPFSDQKGRVFLKRSHLKIPRQYGD